MKILNKFYLLFTALFVLAFTRQANANQEIIYIPLDNRPVCLGYVQKTAKAAGYDLTVPPANLIANNRTSGDNSGLWKWLEANAPKAKAAVIATDSLNYGGLVASRRHNFTERSLKHKVERMQNLKTANPNLKIYAFSTIMRTPKESIGNVEPDYYRYFGPSIFRLSQLDDKEDTGILSGKEAAEKAKLLSFIPSDLLHDWKIRRTINFKTNERLIDLCKDKTFYYFAIGKDDNAPLSQTHMEARHLQHYSGGISSHRFQIMPGVDQVGIVLLTRAINEINGTKPKVFVSYAPGVGGKTIPLYSDEPVTTSVAKQIEASGASKINFYDKADLILAINTPEDGRCQDSTSDENAPYASRANKLYAKELASLTRAHPVALADISYANGADNGFMYELSQRNLLPRFVAYSGWNTADNSIGFALAQGELSKKMSIKDRTNLLKVRYLDDWLYQANIRYRVALEIERHDFKLKYDLGKYYNRVLSGTDNLLAKYVDEEPYLRNTQYSVEFPWNRLFEVDVEVQN
jgi:hypothetical protein